LTQVYACSAGPAFLSAGQELFLKLSQRPAIRVSVQEIRAGAGEQAAVGVHPWPVSNVEVQDAAAVPAAEAVADQAAGQGEILPVSVIVRYAAGFFLTKPGYPVRAVSAPFAECHLSGNNYKVFEQI